MEFGRPVFHFCHLKKAVTIDNNATNDIYLYDLQTATLTLVSINAPHTGSGSDVSDSPAISGDGHFVIYRSFATNLVAGNLNPPPNIYLYDCYTGSNSLVTVASPGPAVLSSWNSKPAINGNGSTLIFQSWNPNLVVNDLNQAQDVLAGTNAPWGTADSDGDGIPDLWMSHYFGHPTGQAGDLSLAQFDADGDGMSNLAEYLAGTDPTNPMSNLQLQIIVQVSATKTVNLNWPAVPGKTYQIQFKDNLTDPVWQDTAGASVLGMQGTFTAPADHPGRFYRAEAD